MIGYSKVANALALAVAAMLLVTCGATAGNPKASARPYIMQTLETQQGYCTTALQKLGYIPKECAVYDKNGNITPYNDDFYTQIDCAYSNSDGTTQWRFIPYDYGRMRSASDLLIWNKGDATPLGLYCDTSVLH